MSLPRLQLPESQTTAPTDSVVLAVYAPFGTDPTLSNYPDGQSIGLAEHPLVGHLLAVARAGAHVAALIDLADDDSYLVEIPAAKTAKMNIVSRWKQDMSSFRTLAGFLRHVHAAYPTSAIVLAMEGHGAGFLPEIDRARLTMANITGNGTVEWHIGGGVSRPTFSNGDPVLPIGCPTLPIGCPTLPTNHTPLSTYAIGEALRSAQQRGVPRVAALHFNNCFNMSVELLHTVAPYAEVATSYENYNFFTAGEAYPGVFERLRAAGTATPLQLAQWFADGNHHVLAGKGHHPTVGGVVALGRMHGIVELIDDLSDALLAALRTSGGAQRAGYVDEIRKAIVRAQQLDSDGNFMLETPDEVTDIRSLAHELQKADFGPYKVRSSAAALEQALRDIKRYGDDGTPWMAPARRWNFSAKDLAMNIFLPDPLRIGKWDWRSPYYLDVNPDPAGPQAQPHIIEFLKVTDWVDFIIEYHKDVPFVGILPAAIPEFPVFNKSYKPPRKEGGGSSNGCDDTRPDRPTAR